MNKKRLTMILVLAVVALGVFVITTTMAQKANRQEQGQANVSSPSGLKPKPADLDRETVPQPVQSNPLAGHAEARPESPEIPQDVVYGQVFRHIKELLKKADDEERQGREGAHFRTLYKRMAKLNEQQSKLLDDVASETNAEIEKLNRRANHIIEKLRAQHPDGKLARGERPPAPPAELAELSVKRRDLVLQARSRLHAAYGEEEFRRFDEFVQQRVKPGIRRLDQPRAPSGAQSQGR